MYSPYWVLSGNGQFYDARMPQTHVASSPAFHDQSAFLKMLLHAIYNERKAQQDYAALHELARTPFQKKNIHEIRQDEIKHEHMLEGIYHTLTGQPAQVPHPGPSTIRDFQSGVRSSFEDEIEAAEMYRTMYLNTHVPWLRDLLFEIMTDEMEHAQRFAYLRAEL